MERRSWPWKKKSSDKGEKVVAESLGATLASGGFQGEKEDYKKPTYVQISLESYTHLTGLEDQVKMYEEQVQSLEDHIEELNEKLIAANTEMTNKDNLVKQHAKVAEEAVSGWEKAEAEAVALKSHLESVTLSKLTAEDRAAHLDGALKECMRQIRTLKEDHEQKLQEVILMKTKQCDKIKLDLEARIGKLDQELLRSVAENAALSRSLQERSNMLIKVSEAKAQAEAEIELLKSNIESCEKEISSLKYEVHLVSKELEIRNEEKNMSVRSAEVANKQHMDGVKKIAKLEAECQRLRGLVRKKLPGPAALAQMKLEVESLGRDCGDSRLKRSSSKLSSPHISSVPDFAHENALKFHKENEFLTERVLAMEEEMKMLKEALAKRNSELLASTDLCAKTGSRLQSLEVQLHMSSQQASPESIIQSPVADYSSQNATSSLSALSEEGNDEVQSFSVSGTTARNLEPPKLNMEKQDEKASNAENAKHLDLMDDFLEMEKLACLDAKNAFTLLESPDNKNSHTVNSDASGNVCLGKDILSNGQHKLDSQPNEDQSTLVKLQARISELLESASKDADPAKLLEDVKRVLQDASDTLPQCSVTSLSNEVVSSDATCDGQTNVEDASLTGEKESSLSQDDKATVAPADTVSQDLAAAISRIHDFIIFLGKEAMSVHDTSCDGNGLNGKIEEFSATINEVLVGNTNLVGFVFDLSHVLAKASELRFNILGYKGNEAELNSPDYIDKVALPENKVVQDDSSGERYQNDCSHVSSPTYNPEVPDDGNLVTGFGSNAVACEVSLEEFEELKSEKDNMAAALARYAENLEMMKSQLSETEKLLAEAKSELASAQKSNSLSETQLKCMAESYRTLEARAEGLETELNLLQAKTETLENELRDAKKSHLDVLNRCKELEEELQAKEKCPTCSLAADIGLQTKQERELAAAAEKLAECQETIFLLGKQLKSLRPQPEFMGSPYSDRSRKGEEDEPTISSMNSPDLYKTDTDAAASAYQRKTGCESPMDYNFLRSPSDNGSGLMRSPISSRNAKHTSPLSSSSNTPSPEKHQRGFSRFFATKSKNGI